MPPLIDAIVYNDERFGINDVRSGLNYLNCPSDATSLSQCTEVRKGSSNGCFKYINKCGTEWGLRCFSKSIYMKYGHYLHNLIY